jgi:4-hydroxybenzoate polyprenyltransferase
MVNLSIAALKVARPVHWVKNFSLFAAIFLTGGLFEKNLFMQVFLAFIAFNFATSATYIFNDILDVKLDRLHPVKKFRPLASGGLPLWIAILEGIIFSLIALAISSSVNYLLFLLIAGYLVMQALYSLGLKNIPIIDILIIAAGFIIRVYSGAVVIDAHLSVWFLLCVISVALFLASGKRRAELNVLEVTNEITRKSLIRYKRELLNSYVTMFGNASWMSWSLYTFFESPKANPTVWLFLAELSRTTTVNKLLMASIPLVIFGIMRYEAVIFEGKAETPERVLLTDKPLIFSIFLWIILIYWIIYSGVSAV